MGYAESIIQFLLSRFENRYSGTGEKCIAPPVSFDLSSFSFVLCLRLLPGYGLSGSVVTFEKCAINGKNC
jgi:hypothetical protein